MLPVAVVPLTSESGRLPSSGSQLRPIFDAPVPLNDVTTGLVSLSLEPRRGTLWAALQDGNVLAWDIIAARTIGRWKLHWPSSLGGHVFSPVRLCEDANQGFLYALSQSPPLLVRVRTMLD